jgi:hypothetical protein
MAAAFFTANLATEKLQGSLYVNFILTSIGKAGHHHAAAWLAHAAVVRCVVSLDIFSWRGVGHCAVWPDMLCCAAHTSLVLHPES